MSAVACTRASTSGARGDDASSVASHPHDVLDRQSADADLHGIGLMRIVGWLGSTGIIDRSHHAIRSFASRLAAVSSVSRRRQKVKRAIRSP